MYYRRFNNSIIQYVEEWCYFKISNIQLLEPSLKFIAKNRVRLDVSFDLSNWMYKSWLDHCPYTRYCKRYCWECNWSRASLIRFHNSIVSEHQLTFFRDSKINRFSNSVSVYVITYGSRVTLYEKNRKRDVKYHDQQII